jgi:hypothetical protein
MKALCFFLLFVLDEQTTGVLDRIAASGRVAEIATPPSERLNPRTRIAPGPPPTLGFRMIEGRLRHRFGDLDLVLDDAGH